MHAVVVAADMAIVQVRHAVTTWLFRQQHALASYSNTKLNSVSSI